MNLKRALIPSFPSPSARINCENFMQDTYAKVIFVSVSNSFQRCSENAVAGLIYYITEAQWQGKSSPFRFLGGSGRSHS